MCQASRQRLWWYRRLVVIILELSHAIVWFVWHLCPDKAELSFFERETAFWCSFKRVPNWRLVCPMYSWLQSLHGMEYIASNFCSFGTGSLGFAKIWFNVKKCFCATLTMWLHKILFIDSVTPLIYGTTQNPSSNCRSQWFCEMDELVLSSFEENL